MSTQSYQEHTGKMADRSAERSYIGRDIGPIPAVVDPARKAAAERDFRLFCESYFPNLFTLAWSDDHLKVIERIETAVLRGSLFAMAMPRGSGKTTLSFVVCLWAMLYGHRQFVFLVGSGAKQADKLLKIIKKLLGSNDLLMEDFPEACYPVRCLKGKASKCTGQHCQGERTYIEWSAESLTMPAIPGSKSSNAVVEVAGITGEIRGRLFLRADGDLVRPDLVIVDDPQTDESARSPGQCETREDTLFGAILNLPGPGEKIAGIMPCTVIQPDDLADRFLDRELHPEWHGIKTRMVNAFPTNEKLWEEYARIRSEDMQAGGEGEKATDFYRDNRDAMDEGAELAWPANFKHDEISALQCAMNIKLRNEAKFFSEYQNEPILNQSGDVRHLTTDEIMGKLNGRARGVVPNGADVLTMFVDIHDALLYWMVCGWSMAQFDGWIVDYGTTPEQPTQYFTRRSATRTLKAMMPNMGIEGAIYAGLEAVVGVKAGHEWMREDGVPMRIGRILIDAGYMMGLVHEFCRQSQHAAILLPAWGLGIKAGSRPIEEYEKRRGEMLNRDYRWWVPRPKLPLLRTIRGDVNWWKSFVRNRFITATGDKGCLSIFGTKPYEHKLLADHLTAATAVRTIGPSGRTVEEWTLIPGRDNHWLDNIVGCAIGASTLDVKLYVVEGAGPVARKRVKLSEIQARKRLERGR